MTPVSTAPASIGAASTAVNGTPVQSSTLSAEEIVRGGLVLKRIAQQEKIELSDAKVNERVAQIAQQWNQKPEETAAFLEKQGVLDRVRDEVLTDQIFDFLIENAKLEA